MGVIEKINYIFNRKQKIKLFILLIMLLVGALLELLGVSAVLPFINLVMNPDEIINHSGYRFLYELFQLKSIDDFVIIFSILLIIIYIIKNLFLIFSLYIQNHFVYHERVYLTTKLMERYMIKNYQFHINQNSSVFVRSLTEDVNYMFDLINTFLSLCSEIAVFIFLGFLLFITDWQISLIVVFLLCSCLLLFRIIFKKRMLNYGINKQKLYSEMVQNINESLGGIKEIKIKRVESYFTDRHNFFSSGFAENIRKQMTVSQIPRFIMEAVCIGGVLLTIIIKIMQGAQLSSIVPQLSIFAVAAFRLLPSANRMSAYYNQIVFYFPSINLVYQDLKDSEKENNKFRNIKKGKEELSLNQDICVTDLSFKYREFQDWILRNVNFKIPIGKSTAFIGPSGAGKTTMADILLGLFPPDSGKITINEVNIYEHLEQWSNLIGYIPQTIYLTDSSIRCNVAFGINDDDISEKKVWKALEEAQLADFVRDQEEGINTVIGEHGVRLSGGQRQRIGIARALYSNPQFLVLDEATSALDGETETAVMEAIDKLHGKKTMLIIAHRLSTIQNCDVVYQIKNGEVTLMEKEQL